ncbi:MAG: hypothetical protein ACRC2R_06785 [Xenococcaceae cyanobacterium]
MSNTIDIIKLFYSQGHQINIELLQPIKELSFCVKSLSFRESQESMDSFILEDIPSYIRENGLNFHVSKVVPTNYKQNHNVSANNLESIFNQLPNSFWESYSFYYTKVSMADFGSVCAFRLIIKEQNTIAVRVTTDGDDGWLEIYDDRGKNLGAARTNTSSIAWRELKWIRTQFPAYPPEIEPKRNRSKSINQEI